MNKFTFAAVSLIGAIPGGYFAYMMVMAMLNYFKDMNGLMRIVTCTALAMSALMAVMPLGIVIFTAKPKTDEDEDTAPKSKSQADDVDDIESSEVDEELDSFDDIDAEPAVNLGGTGDAESEESVVIDTEGMFDDDIYEAEDEDLEEEVAPKKKKKDKKKKK